MARKATSSAWLFTLSLIALAITHSTSHESVVLWNNDQAEVIPDADMNDNSTREEYNDVTDLADGMNHWNFNGMWSKYDLTTLHDEQKLVPENPERQDQAVLICHTLPTGSSLEKKFPALEDGTLVLSYYTAARENFTMVGETQDALLQTKQRIFNYTFPHDLAEHNGTWVTESFHLTNFTNEFIIRFTLTGDSIGLWATDEIEVRGYKPKSAPIVGPGIPEPTNPAPGVNSTEPPIANNVTVAANVTTESNNVTIEVNATTMANNITSGNETIGNGTDTNVNGTDVDNTGNGNATTSQPEIGVPGQSSSLEDSNITAIPSSNFTEAPPSNVSQESNVTAIPVPNWNEHPVVNVTNNPPANISKAPETNLTEGPEVNVSTEVPYPNSPIGTDDPSANVSSLPPVISGNPTKDSPENPKAGYPSGISDTSTLNENVNKLAGLAQAIWDAFYVFLALFCACLVAIVGLIVRGRCKDDDNPPTAVATYNPRTASYRLDKVYDNPSYDTNPV
ncbi:uncharacterized protein [Palaemon carinicauda]|uniref:uncharacterized protein isoform X2 n=1 Tax=Palaemon carinicauda TaxID=392227 RepID=UPI0035B613DF